MVPVHFLNTPVGVVCLLVIGGTSIFNIYAHWIDDGLFGRLLYMATAITCAAGLWHYVDDSVPYHIATTLIALFAIKGVRNAATRSVRYYKYQRKTHAQNKR